MFEPNISVFTSARNPDPVQENYTARNIFDLIKYDQRTRFQIEKIRSEQDKKTRDNLKKSLRAVTWSGTFSKRNTESLIKYSGIICMDIDGLQSMAEAAAARDTVSQSEYVYAAFISPSGNGIKILFRSVETEKQHTQVWQSIADYLKETYNLEADKSGKDICRLCFISHDPEVYINHECRQFGSTDFVQLKAQTEVKPFASGERNSLDLCHRLASKHYEPVAGNYNKYINVFSIFANRYGIDPTECAWAIAKNCGFPSPDKDDIGTIRSVYAKFASENGQWKEKSRADRKQEDAGKPAKKATVQKGIGEVDDSVQFWYKVDKLDKNGEPKCDQNGEVLVDYKLSYDAGIEFLQNNGFFKMVEGDGYRLIRVDEEQRQVEVVYELRLEEFMLGYLKSERTDEFNRVRELFRKSINSYCNPRQFAGLDYYTADFRRDTQDAAYVYFANEWAEITKEGITFQPYSQMKGFIWKKQLIDHKYSPVDFHGCDYHLFILRAISGKKVSHESELDETDLKKYQAAVTGIGYLLHKYKDPALTKAVIAVDKKTRGSAEEMNGGSGKSMYGKAVGKMLNMLTIDGQNFKFDDQFAFQGASLDTELINFNDVNGSFRFHRLFGMLTEGFTYRGLYKNSVTLAYADSPKAYISTNLIIMGEGDSFRRRQHLLEFSDYFNANNTPAKEFKRMFFDQWDDEEWNKFYAFFLHCLQTFLEKGLVDFPIENYNMRKLLEWYRGAGVELNDYLNETILDQLVFNQEFEKKELYNGFIAACSVDVKNVTANAFTKQLELWAKVHGLEINAHKNGERDRRNGKDYLRFTHIPKDPDCNQEEEPDIFQQQIDSYNKPKML